MLVGRCILLFGRCHNLMGGKERKIDHKTLAQVHVHVYNFGTCLYGFDCFVFLRITRET